MTTEKKILIGLGLLTLVLLIGSVFLLSQQGTKTQEKLAKSLMGEEVIEDPASTHVDRSTPRAQYKSNPPTSGPHWGDGVVGPGIKDTEVPDELLIHSMEHGAVVVWYKPMADQQESTQSAQANGLSSEDLAKLKDIFNSASGKKILVPRKNMDSLIALTSWGRLMKLQSLDESVIKEFIETNNDRAPENAPI